MRLECSSFWYMLAIRCFLLSHVTGIVWIRFLLCIPWGHTMLQCLMERTSASPWSSLYVSKGCKPKTSSLGNVNSLKKHLHYLGCLLSKCGIKTLPEETSAMEKLKEPSKIDECYHFLSLTGYYRNNIPLFANVTKPLNKLLKKDTKFQWSL